MNELEARGLLTELAERVPVGEAPIEAVTRHGRQTRTRRRTRRRATAVLVAGVVVIGGAWFVPRLVDGDEAAPVAAQDPQGEEHSYVVGGPREQQVALGRVSVAVPATWTVGQPGGCLDAAAGTVTASTQVKECSTPSGADLTVVIGPVQSMVGPGEDLALTTVDHDGLEVRIDPAPVCLGATGGGRICNAVALVPDEDMVVRVSGTGRGFDNRAAAILDSVSLLPEGRVAIPPGLVGRPIDQVREDLRRLGFSVSTGGSGNQSFDARTTSVGPAPGTVLDQGANVRIWYGDASNARAGVDLQGQWTIRLVGSEVSTPIRFDGFEVSIGVCTSWQGGHLITGDDVRFTDLVENELADGVGCDFEDAAEVAALLARVRHATGGGREVRLHLESYQIVATLRR